MKRLLHALAGDEAAVIMQRFESVARGRGLVVDEATVLLAATLIAAYPALRGTIRDQTSKQRRPFIRFFACEKDLSLQPTDAPLPEPVAAGREPLLIVGAIAGG